MHMKIRALDAAIVLAFGLMIVAIALQVVYRYVLNDPLAGSEEIGRLALVWITFVGAAVATRDNMHIRIDYFVQHLKPGSARAVRILEHVATAVFGLVMVWVGYLLSVFSLDYESASLQFPMTVVHASVPVAGALIALVAIRKAIAEFGTRQEAP
jgi:TRAP-type transport system small permease protein